MKIAVTIPVRETFLYTVPEYLTSRAGVGYRVLVPFRNRKAIGYILEKVPEKSETGLKDIMDILDPYPLFHKNLVPLFQWMAEYYLYPLGCLIQSALPGGLNVTSYKTGRLTERGIAALRAVSRSSEDKSLLEWIEKNPGKRFPPSLHKFYKAQEKGWLTIENHTRKGSTGPLMRRFIRARGNGTLESVLGNMERSSRNENEWEFLKTIFASGGIPLKELSSRFPHGQYLVKKWTKKGVLESFMAPVFRNPAGEILFTTPVPQALFDQQKEALKVIKECLDRKVFSTCLFHGVTGSGKTEVYWSAVEHVVMSGRQAILLAPEIALAIYMEGIFRPRLGDRLAVYHSGLSNGERYDQWIRMAKGDVDMVIGARSALFAPLPNVGLIIVDEEHDLSYKQEESPRYQARDAAVVRGKLEGALVLLGSGTPSIQSYHNAMTGRYRLISMPERIEKRPLPDIRVVDMKDLSEGRKGHGFISPFLRQAIERDLRAGRQVMLFLNRRGYHRVHLCRLCGESLRCSNCEVVLIHHLKENRLVCHYCGFHTDIPKRCPSCRRGDIRAYGFGTEKLEKEIGEIFPHGRIARMDKDSTRGKGQAYHILKKFADHEVDVLVGTQMITKGYHFPKVTLVGVIAADLSLEFPDFRAGERTFQLLSQVAGRSGRGDQKGEVVIQTFNPGHYAIKAAKDHDYDTFYHNERDLRKQLGYPPFSFLSCLRLQGNSQEATARMSHHIISVMRDILEKRHPGGKGIQILGPAESPLSKLKGKYRWHILVKSKKVKDLHDFLLDVDECSRKVFKGSGVGLTIDVDPYHML